MDEAKNQQEQSRGNEQGDQKKYQSTPPKFMASAQKAYAAQIPEKKIEPGNGGKGKIKI